MERKQCIELIKEYNKESFHIEHALTVGSVMKYFARKLGYDENYWENIGILHDIDFEMYPEEHCIKAVELLEKAGVEEAIIRSVCSHAYGMRTDIKPEHEMEKVLYATDELTGLIGAAAKMRPSKSTKDMEVSSLKKKFKDKKFAAGCSRDVIINGAEMLDWELDKLLEETIMAMRESEDSIREELLK